MVFMPKSKDEATKLAIFLWITFMFSIIIYVFIAYLLTEQWAQSGEAIAIPGASDIIHYLFSFLSFVSVVIAVFIRRTLPSVFIKRMVKGLGRKSNLSGDMVSQRAVIKAVLSYPIIIAAFVESSAVYGLVLVFFSKELFSIIPFALLSFLGFVILWPTGGFIEAIINKVNSLLDVRENGR